MTSSVRRRGAVRDVRRPPTSPTGRGHHAVTVPPRRPAPRVAGLFRRGRRATVRALTAAVALAAAAGCGVRPTSVPVDAGPAPTRDSCDVPSASATPTADDTVADRVYLVCGSRVLAVPRQVRTTDDADGGGDADDRLAVARTLLRELQRPPHGPEATAGFTTDVPNGLRVDGPREGDPAAALRLSTEPPALPSFALAQLVCTYAGTAAADSDRSVVLGGPAPDARRPYLRYECDRALRAAPEAARTAGTPL